MIHLTLTLKKNVKNCLFRHFHTEKKSILCQKISKISDFFLNLGQLQKMQKSAKGLISFFCKVYVSPLIGKKIDSGKTRHWEKLTDI
jgi:hypothetical protein